MNQLDQDKLAKKIKKNLYGKPQTILAVFPAGMAEPAHDEVTSILNHLWFKQKYHSEISIVKNILRIDQIHLFAVTELLMRSQSLVDIRLVVFEGSASGKSIFRKKCQEINWDFYLNKNISLKIKVNSVASRAFHESGLKEIVSDILKDHVSHIVSGENTDETTSLYVDLYKNKLTVSLSLAGEALYKRGFRDVLSASAPLREDAAFCCIARALNFAKKQDEHFLVEALLVPFSGTGTFAFEYLQTYFNFSSVLFLREYALAKMSFFNQDNYNFLLKKAREHVFKPTQDIQVKCIDNATHAINALTYNINQFNSYIDITHVMTVLKEDFFEMDGASLVENKNILMPLNPPYGIRLGKNTRAVDVYRQIAKKVNHIAELNQKTGKKILGFVLCPDENTWSCFFKNLKNMNTETYHFTQGGLDIRVCQFLTVPKNPS